MMKLHLSSIFCNIYSTQGIHIVPCAFVVESFIMHSNFVVVCVSVRKAVHAMCCVASGRYLLQRFVLAF